LLSLASSPTFEERRARMGNCQAAEAAAAVVQHPGGRVERLYWATSAAEVMRANPGHYVALVTLRVAEERHENADGTGARRTVRLTRLKLLKPKETLLLGNVYRLITSHGKLTNYLAPRRPLSASPTSCATY
jgi:hypothetical protein